MIELVDKYIITVIITVFHIFKKVKIDTLSRDMKDVKILKSHFSNVLNHTKQRQRLKLYTR